MADKKQIDWERIELEYRAGLLSVREIAASHGITHGAINKRSKRDGWERDLTARIRAKADALVSKAEVSKSVSIEQVATERQTVEANARVIADVRLAHRNDINRVRNLLLVMLGELESITADNGLFLALGDMLLRPSENGTDRLNELYLKVVGIPSRVDSIKKISETLKTLITLEREAYGLQTDDGAGTSVPSGLGHFYGQ